MTTQIDQPWAMFPHSRCALIVMRRAYAANRVDALIICLFWSFCAIAFIPFPLSLAVVLLIFLGTFFGS
jgi:hypothetical protein